MTLIAVAPSRMSSTCQQSAVHRSGVASSAAPAAGAVLVRPTWLIPAPTMNR